MLQDQLFLVYTRWQWSDVPLRWLLLTALVVAYSRGGNTAVGNIRTGRHSQLSSDESSPRHGEQGDDGNDGAALPRHPGPREPRPHRVQQEFASGLVRLPGRCEEPSNEYSRLPTQYDWCTGSQRCLPQSKALSPLDCFPPAP